MFKRFWFCIENRNIPVNFLLSLERKAGTGIIYTNGAEIFGHFGKSGKKVMPRKVTPFSQNIFPGFNRSLDFSSGFLTGMIGEVFFLQ